MASDPSPTIEAGRVLVATVSSIALAWMFIRCNGVSCTVGTVPVAVLSTTTLLALGLPPLFRAYAGSLPTTQSTNDDP